MKICLATRSLWFSFNLLTTLYIFPQEIHWMPMTGNGVPRGAYEAYLRGKESDKCGQLVRVKFSNGFTYPWHVNGFSGIYTVLKGTLVIGFDEHHRRSAEKVLPVGSVVQGLAKEPHYGRAIGETIFDFYSPCK